MHHAAKASISSRTTAFFIASVVQVTARSEARSVGMLAFRKAAWERQREESLLQSRRKLAAELGSVTDPEQAAVLLAKPLSTRFAGQTAFPLGFALDLASPLNESKQYDQSVLQLPALIKLASLAMSSARCLLTVLPICDCTACSICSIELNHQALSS